MAGGTLPSDELTFSIQSIALSESATRRSEEPWERADDVVVDYEMPTSLYKAGGREVTVATRYRVSLYLEGARDSRPDDEPMSEIATTFRVVMEASRDLSEADAQAGNLEPARALAVEASHHYHRQLLRSLSVEMDLAPIELPSQPGVPSPKLGRSDRQQKSREGSSAVSA
jgi:hypothetical protein